MRLVRIGLAVSLAAALAALLPVTEASAQRFRAMGGSPGRGGPGHFVSSPHMAPRSFGQRGFGGRHVSPHHFRHRGFVGGFGSFGVVSTPLVVYAPPPFYYGSPGYVDPPVYYSPPPVYYGPPAVSASQVSRGMSMPAAPPPPPNVEHSTGRYELRGDGVATPYAWVWVPNPPPAPPSAPPPSDDGGKPRRQDLYRWTDDQGVLHITDRLEIVPPEHRGQAKPAS